MYWAEQYFTLKKIQDEDSQSELSTLNTGYFLRVRRVINIAFWILTVLSFLFVTPFAVLIVAMDHKGFGYSTVAYQISRLVIRLVLSWGVCLTLVVFGK